MQPDPEKIELYTAAINAMYPRYRLTSDPPRSFCKHQCTNACPFFQHSSLYICTFSCNFHVCTSEECNQLVSDPQQGQSICSLTGTVYAGEFGEMTFEQRQHVIVETDPKARGKKRKHTAESDQIRERLQKGGKGVTSRKLDQVHDKRARYHANEALALVMLKQLLPQPVDMAIVTQLQQVAMRLWLHFINTPSFAEHVCSYKFEYHILAVLNEVDSGKAYECQGKVLVPRIGKLHDKIKFISRFTNKPLPVLQKYRLTSNGFTKCRKIFRECVEQCIDKL
jgi:hypothetical protein